MVMVMVVFVAVLVLLLAVLLVVVAVVMVVAMVMFFWAARFRALQNFDNVDAVRNLALESIRLRARWGCQQDFFLQTPKSQKEEIGAKPCRPKRYRCSAAACFWPCKTPTATAASLVRNLMKVGRNSTRGKGLVQEAGWHRSPFGAGALTSSSGRCPHRGRPHDWSSTPVDTTSSGR
jgi:hypothetical protein